MNFSCQFDRECPQNEVCFVNVSWNAEQKSFCGCSTFYGFARDTETNVCTSLDRTGIFWLVSGTFLMLSCFVCFFISVFDIFHIFKVTKTLGVLLTTSIFGLFYFSSLIIEVGLATWGNLMTPIYSPVRFSDVSDPNSDKIAYLSIYERIFISTSILFFFLFAINIPLYWIELSIRIKEMSAHVEINVSRFRKPVIVTQVFFAFLLILVGPILGLYTIGAVLFLPFLVGVMLMYVYGIQVMNATMKESSNNDLVSSLRTYTIRIVVCLLLCFISALSYAITGFLGWREVSIPGRISWIALASIFRRSSAVLFGIMVLSYTHSRAIALLRKSNGNTATSLDSSANLSKAMSVPALNKLGSSSLLSLNVTTAVAPKHDNEIRSSIDTVSNHNGSL